MYTRTRKPSTHVRRSLLSLALLSVFGGTVAIAAEAPPVQDMRIDEAAKMQVVEAVGSILKQFYVYPEKAVTLDKVLRADAKSSEFSEQKTGPDLAEKLTQVLQEQSGDKHLEVRYFPETLPPDNVDQEPSKAEQDAENREHRRYNFGFEQVGRFKGNIGYLSLTEFGRPKQTASRIVAAMDLLSDTGALIIDLRKTGGGDPDSVMLLASYFFDKPTHLNDIYWREGNRTESRWTQKKVSGKRYGEARKIYVLTSQRTFSAGEDFAYALKYAGRATLIGETTGGGAHPGNPRRLTDHFMMFVPNGRAINPVTHGDWEGVGVQPDVAIPADQALDQAQIMALNDMIATERDDDWKRRLQKRRDELQASARALGMGH